MVNQLELSTLDRQLLQVALFQTPLAFAALLERVVNARHIISTLNVTLPPATIVSQSSITNSIVQSVVSPPTANIGLVLTQFARTGISSVTFNGIKDGNVVITSRSPRSEQLPVPNPWLPFRQSYIMQFVSGNPLSATGPSTTVARADIVFVPNEVWRHIETILQRTLGNLGSDLGFDFSGVKV